MENRGNRVVNMKESLAVQKQYEKCLKYKRRLTGLFTRLEKMLKKKSSNVPQCEIDNLYKRGKKARNNLRKERRILKLKMKATKRTTMQGKSFGKNVTYTSIHQHLLFI